MRIVSWTRKASLEVENITDYWSKRNYSTKYSNKILDEIEGILYHLSVNPELGIKTDSSSVRMRLILNNFYIFYSWDESRLNVLKFWDTRQNPENNEYLS